MSYDPIPAQPTSGQNPWYDTMSAWMDGVETAIDQVDTGWEAHAATTASHVPAGGTNGQVLTKVAGVPAWADPTGTGGTSDHGTLTGLSDPDHPIAAVSGLQAALDAKALVGHNHSGTYEPLGTATSVVGTHEAASNPHPIYLTQAEADALYAVVAAGVPLSGTTGHVLTKTAGCFTWAVAHGGGGAAAPLVLTAPTSGDIPLKAVGASGQTVHLMRAELSDATVAWAIEADQEMRLGPNIATLNGALRVGVGAADRNGLLIKGFSGQTAKFASFTDSANSEKFSVDKDGTVVGANIGGIFKTAVILDAAEAIPTGLPSETLVLRRPA